MSAARPVGVSSLYVWRIEDGDPLVLADVLHDVHRWLCDGAPGTAVATVHYANGVLKIETRA